MKLSEARRAEGDARRDIGFYGVKSTAHEGTIARYLSASSYDKKPSRSTEVAAAPSATADKSR